MFLHAQINTIFLFIMGVDGGSLLWHMLSGCSNPKRLQKPDTRFNAYPNINIKMNERQLNLTPPKCVISLLLPGVGHDGRQMLS